MDYTKTVPFNGDSQKALEFSLNLFTQQGFTIVRKHEYGHELTGPGMVSSRQNPLVGISKVIVRIKSGQIKVQAEFGGIKKMQTFLILFICGMALFFFILFGFLFRNRPNFNMLLPLAPFLPWPILIPVMIKSFKARTRRALDTLLNNMSMMGEET